MVVFIRLIGICVIALGIIFLLNPNMMKEYMAFWTKGKRIYIGASLSIMIGILLLLSASQCRFFWVIAIAGILALIKGIALFVLGPEKLKTKINWWTKRSAIVLRILAFIVLVIGVLLIYSA